MPCWHAYHGITARFSEVWRKFGGRLAEVLADKLVFGRLWLAAQAGFWPLVVARQGRFLKAFLDGFWLPQTTTRKSVRPAMICRYSADCVKSNSVHISEINKGQLREAISCIEKS